LRLAKQNAIHLVGEPGIGKTAMFHRLVERTGYRGVYIDTPNVELGELGIPMPEPRHADHNSVSEQALGFSSRRTNGYLH
jgi:hypothetical protein